jgi:hypothetical protein
MKRRIINASLLFDGSSRWLRLESNYFLGLLLFDLKRVFLFIGHSFIELLKDEGSLHGLRVDGQVELGDSISDQANHCKHKDTVLGAIVEAFQGIDEVIRQ